MHKKGMYFVAALSWLRFDFNLASLWLLFGRTRQCFRSNDVKENPYIKPLTLPLRTQRSGKERPLLLIPPQLQLSCLLSARSIVHRSACAYLYILFWGDKIPTTSCLHKSRESYSVLSSTSLVSFFFFFFTCLRFFVVTTSCV